MLTRIFQNMVFGDELGVVSMKKLDENTEKTLYIYACAHVSEQSYPFRYGKKLDCSNNSFPISYFISGFSSIRLTHGRHPPRDWVLESPSRQPPPQIFAPA